MPGYNLQQLLDLGNEAMQIMAQAQLGPSNDTEIVAGQNCASVLRQFMEYEIHRPNVPPPSGFTRAQISDTANRAANMIRRRVFPYETSRTIAANTLMDLVVNATLTLLDNPEFSLDDVIAENWQMDDQECSECGGICFVTDTGVAHHGSPGRIDYDSDGDHVAIPEPASEADMVFGWLEDLH